ncbi:PBP1A family penicillin-binding protein [Gammaproteobacteria bacterium]|nr:PBP1A family penicillin-binding protein [Gammaproteobacteria bacterium]
MKFSKLISLSLTLIALILSLMILCALYAIQYLPSTDHLTNIDYKVPLRIYTQDHQLIGQYGEKFRYPVQLNEIPLQLQNAYIAIEDQRFHQHPGIDPIGLARASLSYLSTGKKSQGASTITMQVARNFFLSNHKTWARKFNEILLAMKIEATQSKSQILELYLNKIYLGNRAYGVAAASEIYYNKSLTELTLAEMAMLAGLPKSPSQVNPIQNPEKAVERRNLILLKMLENDYITQDQYQTAVAEPDHAKYHGAQLDFDASHVSETVHQLMLKNFGKKVYTQGLTVITTIHRQLQDHAQKTIQHHINNYADKFQLNQSINIENQRHLSSESWFLNHKKALPPMTNMAVIMMQYPESTMIKTASEQWLIIASIEGAPGDILSFKNDQWTHETYQQPQVAFTVMNNHTGAIQALIGSVNDDQYFNRATQAYRQVGSTFKPLLYATALANGLSLAAILNDAPYVSNGGGGDLIWRPANHDATYGGPMRLRDAMIGSRNLVSIRILDLIGIPKMINESKQYGLLTEKLPKDLSLSLGTGQSTVTAMTSAYSTFANKGNRAIPFIASGIYNQKGHRVTLNNEQPIDGIFLTQQKSVAVIHENIAYLMFDLLQDVVKRGTARKARSIGRSDIGGKTGTTNGLKDTWFCGLNGDYSASVWAGFDQFQSLNTYANGLALPIWIDIMADWLKHQPLSVPEKPNDIVSRKIPGLSGKKSEYFELFDRSNPDFESHQSTLLDPNSSTLPRSQIF